MNWLMSSSGFWGLHILSLQPRPLVFDDMELTRYSYILVVLFFLVQIVNGFMDPSPLVLVLSVLLELLHCCLKIKNTEC
jgi:hypothetical protein